MHMKYLVCMDDTDMPYTSHNSSMLNEILDPKRLIEFGKMAKQAVTNKQAAYDLARETGIHLSEQGGTGDGVIGAIAGIGLRLSGNDGRYCGWYLLGMPR